MAPFTEWIAWQLEDAGYTTVLQAWDFVPGSNFVVEIDKAAQQAKRTISVLSPSYLTAMFTLPEWASTFAGDPTGAKRKLVPVRVAHCDVSGLLDQVVYLDLVGFDRERARERLLAGVRDRLKPSEAPAFPGDSHVAEPSPAFPGEEEALARGAELGDPADTRDNTRDKGGEGDIERLALLKRRYDEGRGVSDRVLRPRDGPPIDPEMQARQQERAKTEVLEWAKGTYEILRCHFPGYESDFFGPYRQLGPSLFVIAFEEELAQAGTMLEYLERKLNQLADIFKRLDTAPVYVSRSRRAIEECLTSGGALRDQIDVTSTFARVKEIKRQVEAWAADTSVVVRREAPEYSAFFTRFSSAGDSPKAINGYLVMRFDELRRIVDLMET